MPGIDQDIASLASSANKLVETFQSKEKSIDDKVNEAKEEFQRFQDSSRSELGFVAQNYNHDFYDVYTVDNGQTLPVAMGLPLNFFDMFEVKIIPVENGVEPELRDPVAQELLNAMGCNRKNFSSTFNILHVKRIPNSPKPTTYAFHIPHQHIKTSQGASFVFWAKGRGASWDMDTDMVWKQGRHVWNPATSGSSGEYVHVDIWMTHDDSELYLALPTIVVGHWPENRKLGNLYNLQSSLIRKFGAA